MAANSRSAGAIAGLGKRITNQICTSDSAISSSALKFRRAAHTSAYDKNPDEQVRPSIVPDDVIQPQAAEKYWAPHPHTGVFGPEAEQPTAAVATRAADGGNHAAVEEEKAWFRPTSLEDSEKPHGF
ncbi:late embryogenesis abundant protein At5g17165-like isoform X1 [Cucurbita maxima]|uniref:Late embryogenesis abundant protein At5g17165-like isoform X1 n=1 Tax=Cucurbita maxima TaxID=3661 RepID=A0A6J1JRN3_CUCMA|nr:late embryogenesis abundant protein At5g17165-like isoform X1 [Cucurbita maxima]